MIFNKEAEVLGDHLQVEVVVVMALEEVQGHLM
jgi:hypothetical protein